MFIGIVIIMKFSQNNYAQFLHDYSKKLPHLLIIIEFSLEE